MKKLTIVILIGVLVPCSVLWAAKGDIVPEKKAGVEIVKGKAGALAEVKTASFKVDLGVISRNGILYLTMKVWNTGQLPLNIDPNTLKLETEGVVMDPLSPEKFIAATSDYKPYQVDAAGQIISRDSGGGDAESSSRPAGGDGMGGFGGRGGRGGRGGGGKGGSKGYGAGTPAQRMQATKALVAEKKDILNRSGVVSPGESAEGRHTYPRTGLELPFVITFQPPGSPDSVKVNFVREK